MEFLQVHGWAREMPRSLLPLKADGKVDLTWKPDPKYLTEEQRAQPMHLSYSRNWAEAAWGANRVGPRRGASGAQTRPSTTDSTPAPNDTIDVGSSTASGSRDRDPMHGLRAVMDMADATYGDTWSDTGWSQWSDSSWNRQTRRRRWS